MTHRPRLLALVVRLYPARFRDRFQKEVFTTFDAAMRAARPDGRPAVFRQWLRHAAGVVAALPHAWRSELAHRRRRREALALSRAESVLPIASRGLSWLKTVAEDASHAQRGLRRTPGFSLSAAGLLALGAGACATVLCFIQAVLLRPLPLPAPERLVRIEERVLEPRPGRASLRNLTLGDIDRIRSGAVSIAAISGVFANGSTPLTGRGPAERIPSARVGGDFFAVAGVQPAAGRALTAADQDAGSERVVVLGHAVWRQLFGEASALDSMLTINYQAHRVVGIMPAGFDYPGEARMWLPLQRTRFSEGFHVVGALARLRAGATVEGAAAEVDGLLAAAARAEPSGDHGGGARVTRLREAMTEDVRPALYILEVAAAFVLLLVCLNVGGLLLDRTVGRARELAVRRSLGATNARVLRLLVFEGVMLGVAGSILGVALCALTLGSVVALSPVDLPLRDTVRLDGSVVLLVILAGLAAGLIAGLAPAFQTRRGGAAVLLRSERARAGPGRAGVVLVSMQIALATVLVIGAGLLLRSFVAALRVEPGLRVDGMMTSSVSLSFAHYPESSDQLAFFDRALTGIRSLPGVDAAELSLFVPLRGGIGTEASVPDRGDAGQRAYIQPVSPGYFDLLRIPLLEGRAFDERDASAEESVAIINRVAARRFWAGDGPVGQRLVAQGHEWRIVGVVADVHETGILEDVEPAIYVPFASYDLGGGSFLISSRIEPAVLADAVRGVIRDLDPDLPIDSFETIAGVIDESLARPRFYSAVVGVFGVLSLSVAIAGLYAVVVFNVRRRLFELGVRAALGARPRDNLRLILGTALRVTAIGLGAGLVLSFWLGRTLGGLMFRTRTDDPVVFVVACGLMTCAAIAASLTPALEAARTRPAEVLRSS